METLLSQLSQRKFSVTEYYEHWKVHVTSGKQFKTQWQQFVQDARKVRCRADVSHAHSDAHRFSFEGSGVGQDQEQFVFKWCLDAVSW